MSFNHSAFTCMKSLLIICSKSAKVMSKQCCSKLFFRIKLFKVTHLVERSTEQIIYLKCLSLIFLSNSFYLTNDRCDEC